MNTDFNKLVQAKYCGLLFSIHLFKESVGLKSYCEPSQEQEKPHNTPSPNQREKKAL